MKIRKFIIFLAVFLGIEILLGIFAVRSGRPSELDMVKLNELTHACAAAWPQLERGEEVRLPDPEYDYALLDSGGKLLYDARGNQEGLTLQKAIQRRDTVVDLLVNEKPVGKLVLVNDYARQAGELNRRVLLLLGSNAVLFIFFWLGYFLYLKKRMFTPFQQLKTFAARVANGNLDIPLTMDRDNLFGAFTESFDLMRDALKRAREQERKATQSKKELVAKLSHDIKTPVASIKAVSEVMAVNAQGEKERQQLGVIEAKADQIDALISNLFHATLEELQELNVQPSEQDSRTVRELLLQADYLKRAEIGDIPECLVLFDPLRLQQVFDNLFGNSYKYANTSIRVTAALTAKQLEFCICDYGPGVPPGELPLIFEKFARGKNAEGKSGAGLGLYISHYLVEKMGGTLTCENTGEGFCARVGLKI